MRKPNSSAADRTAHIFAEVMMPQANHAPRIVELDGPEVYVVGLDMHDGLPAYHYVMHGVKNMAICGLQFKFVNEGASGSMDTCMACRVEASKIRATVR